MRVGLGRVQETRTRVQLCRRGGGVFDVQSIDMQPTVLQYWSSTPVIPRNIVLHYSRFRCAWDWLILVLTTQFPTWKLVCHTRSLQ